MWLTWEGGKFVLENDLRLALGIDVWEVMSDGRCATNDFKAAAKFRAFASSKAQKILNRAFVKRYPAPASPLPPFLDPHQIDGVRWVLTRSRSYLAHAPGAGKTWEAVIAAILTEAGGQALFVVPPSLTVNWAREVTYIAALMRPRSFPMVAVIPDSANQDYAGWGAEFVIVPDSMLTRDWVLTRLIEMPKRFVAVDEASRFKEATAQRTLALFGGELSDGRVSPGLIHDEHCRHAVLLDGSPMPNRPMELWAPTYAMCPESIDFMNQQEFGMQFCGARLNDFGRWEFRHDSNADELKRRLQKDFMHVVPEEALKHPERRRSLLLMSDDVRTLAMQKWERTNLSKISFDDISEGMSKGDIAHHRKELGLKKVPWTVNYVKQRCEDKNEAILVFAWHREVCHELERQLGGIGFRLIMGGTPKDERTTIIERFQEGTIRGIIGNIAAMGRGNNLQAGDRAVFHEWSWSDEDNKQCEKRISRRGNNKAFMRSDYIACPNSLDEITLGAVFRKADRVKRIVG